jgi:hypothetical protein
MRWLLFLALAAVAGCTHELVWEPTAQVTLSGGLEVRWRSLDQERAAGKPLPLVLTFRSVGAGPVVLCRVLRVDGAGESPPAGRSPSAGEGPAAVFVHPPEPGRFRYDADSDSVVGQSASGAPFSLAPAFAWYDQVLYPRAEGVSVNLGEGRVPASPMRAGATPAFETGARAGEGEPAARVVVEYMPLSYRRLSVAGYAPAVAATGKAGETEDRFRRLSDDLLRRRQPRALFLRNEYLPPVTRVPLEIPWGTRRP